MIEKWPATSAPIAAADLPLLYLEYRLGGALALRLERVEHVHNVNHFPKAIRHASGHCRANSQRLVKPDGLGRSHDLDS
jgi:hypothetical protein